jgi:hypothetical protein
MSTLTQFSNVIPPLSIKIFYYSSGTFTAPVTGYYRFYAMGSGGNGGQSNATNSRASGGGAGGLAIKTVQLNVNDSVTITVGAAPTIQTAGGTRDGNNGNASSAVGPGSAWTITGNGGNGGVGNASSVAISGGTGGTATGGDINFTGGSGGEITQTTAILIATGGGAVNWLGTGSNAGSSTSLATSTSLGGAGILGGANNSQIGGGCGAPTGENITGNLATTDGEEGTYPTIAFYGFQFTGSGGRADLTGDFVGGYKGATGCGGGGRTGFTTLIPKGGTGGFGGGGGGGGMNTSAGRNANGGDGGIGGGGGGGGIGNSTGQRGGLGGQGLVIVEIL